MYESEVNDSSSPLSESYIYAPHYARLARSLGVLALISSVFGSFYLAFIVGGVAIVLAALSRGEDLKLSRPARIAMACGILALALQVAALFFSMYAIMYIPEYRMQLSDIYESMYGYSLDEAVSIIQERMNLIFTGGGNL